MAESLLCAGDVYLDRLDGDGTTNGYLLTGNAVKLEIQPQAEIKEQTSKGRATYGQVLASVAINQPAQLTIDLNQLDRTNLAMAFMGTDSDIAVTGASVSDEAVTAQHDKYTPLEYRDVSSVVVTDSTGVTTYVADTDYTVNARTGMIMALSTGDIADAESLLVSYTYATHAGYKVVGGTQPTIRARILMDGKNLVNDRSCFVTIWEAQVTPASPVDFLADEFAALSLTGTMLTPTGKSSPFQYEEWSS